MFCTKCGAKLVDGARFCSSCGAAASSKASAPQQNASQPFNPAGQFTNQQPVTPPVQPMQQQMKNFSAIKVRYRCPNGHVFDGNEQQTVCPTCGAPLPKGGYIQIYRMGNFSGAAVGMGVYVDDIPYGHVANKESIRISLPFGAHKIHMTHTTTRKCNDPIITIAPNAPSAFCKAHFTKAGFAIAIEPASPADMPER